MRADLPISRREDISSRVPFSLKTFDTFELFLLTVRLGRPAANKAKRHLVNCTWISNSALSDVPVG